MEGSKPNVQKLPAEIQAQLDRLAELEKEHKELLGKKTELEKQLEAKGIQAQLYEDQPVEIEITNDDGSKRTEIWYRHKIDLPPSAGWSLMTNGVPYYHGETYSFAIDQLKDIREREFRAWQHEETIRGTTNENAYRPKMNTTLSLRRGR